MIATLAVDPASGLTSAEAGARLERHGPNRLPEARGRGALAVVAAQFASPLIYLLVLAALVALALGHPTDAMVIAVVLLLNAAIGAFHELRAARSLAALRQLASPRVRVVRDGRERSIDATALVPGDVVVVEAGDVVPADLRLVDAEMLRVVEAALTGEAEAVAKSPTAVPADAPLGDRSSLAHAGTHAVAGRGRGVVVATAAATELGRIATLASATAEPVAPLAARIASFARHLTLAALAMFAAVLALGAARGLDLGEVLLVAMSQLVGMVPEGLPIALTVAFAVGVERMARRRAIVRRLSAVQALGEVAVICSDKTGTLTLNELTATAVLLPDGRELEVSAGGDADGGALLERGAPIGRPNDLLRALLEATVLCNDAVLASVGDDHLGDPLEVALLVLARKAGLDADAVRRANPRRAEIAFDPATRLMATAHVGPAGRTRVVIKGAPEAVLALCHARASATGPLPLDDAARAQLHDAVAAQGRQARRVIAFAAVTGGAFEPQAGTAALAGRATLLGCVAQIDPPRPEAAPAIAACRAAGIRTVMVTGDHGETGTAIARAIGMMAEDERAIVGRELDAMSQPELVDGLGSIRAFCRVHPAQKLRIVDACRERGEVVAMTGDGVNDAPALMASDVGIAMGRSGTEVARQAADIVLADDNIATIVAAVEEGRLVHRNVRKVLVYLLSTSVAEVLVLMLALAAGLAPPLAAVQILWINLVTEGTVTIALVMDPPDGDEMRRRPERRDAPLLDRAALGRMATMTATITSVTLGWYAWRTSQGAALSQVQTETFTLLAACQWANALNCRSPDLSAFASSPFRNRWLATGLAVGMMLQALVVLEPTMAAAFHTARFGLGELLAIVALASAVLWVEELRKRVAAPRPFQAVAR